MTQKQMKAMSTLLVKCMHTTATHSRALKLKLKWMCLSLFACIKTIRFNKISAVSLCNGTKFWTGNSVRWFMSVLLSETLSMLHFYTCTYIFYLGIVFCFISPRLVSNELGTPLTCYFTITRFIDNSWNEMKWSMYYGNSKRERERGREKQ